MSKFGLARAFLVRNRAGYGEFGPIDCNDISDEQAYLACCVGDLSDGNDILILKCSKCLAGDLGSLLKGTNH